MLSEEALILSVVAGACMLLVLGVLELVWPSKPSHPVRRPQAQPAPPRPAEAIVPARLSLNVASSRPPAEIVFRRPAGYVAPPPPEAVAAPDPTPPAIPPPPPEAVAPGPTAPDTPEPPAEAVPPARPTEHVDPLPPPERPAPRPTEHVAPSRPAEPAPPAPRRRRSKISPHARPHGVLRAPTTQAGPGAEPATPDLVPLGDGGTGGTDPEQPVRPWGGSPALPMPETKSSRDSPLVEACFALYQEKRFGEVVSVGEETLAKLSVEWPASASHDTAALWSVVGLAKQALGDDDGARSALELAIDTAPEVERATYRRHLAALALDAAQARRGRAGSHDTGDRVATIRAAIAWTERGLAAVASDPALSNAREAAHEALWQAYEEAVTGLLQRQEFDGARQLLHEALDDSALPAVRAAGFRGLLSSTFGAEVGQLTAQAILNMQEAREPEALESLRHAEEVLATIPAESLPPTRRAELDQRLWWGYAELGSRRLEAGAYEEALDPLTHALGFDSIGPDRQAETRAAVVRALEGIAAVRALSIRRLSDAGCRDEAAQGAEHLRTLLRNCVELGLTEGELWAAYTRIQRLCEELGLEEPA